MSPYWKQKLSRSPAIDEYDLLISCSETAEELGMGDNKDDFEKENEIKKIMLPKRIVSLWCLVLLSLPEHTTGAANIPTKPQSRGCTGTLMCCAPRLRAALTPQPAARVTDVRTCFKSEDENQQGNQDDGILSYHFTPQMPELENIFFLQY